MEQTLEALARFVNGHLIGDGTILIHGVNTLEAVQTGELSFAEDPRHLAQANATAASAILVPSHIHTLDGKPGISVANPKLAFASLLTLFHPDPVEGAGAVHPTAVLGEGVQLGEHVDIGPHAVLGKRVTVGRGTVIASGVSVGDDTVLGAHVQLDPNVVIYRQTRIGDRVRIHGGTVIGGDGFGYVFHEGRHVKVPQIGNVVIEDDVEIGCNVCVDRATIGSTVIRRGTKIDNLVQIAHNNQIGQHVIITGLGGLCGSVTIGDYAVLGGRTTVTDHVTLGAGTQAGLASVITKSTSPGQVVWGMPARPAHEARQESAAVRRLPGLLKTVSVLLARLTRLEAQAAAGHPLAEQRRDKV